MELEKIFDYIMSAGFIISLSAFLFFSGGIFGVASTEIHYQENITDVEIFMRTLDKVISEIHWKKETPNSIKEIAEDCAELNLKEFAECAKRNMETFYDYKFTKGYVENFTYIKENGGDCSEYSWIYFEVAKEAGINATYRGYHSIKNITAGHRFTTVWDEKYICDLDQMMIKCWEKDII